MTDSPLYKAVRPDGTDFFSGNVRWAPPAAHAFPWLVKHPTATEVGPHPAEFLSVSTDPTECTGMRWPCRLLLVEPVGQLCTPNANVHPDRRAGVAFRVIGEADPTRALGPQGAHVTDMLARVARLTVEEVEALGEGGGGHLPSVPIVRLAAQKAAASAAVRAAHSACVKLGARSWPRIPRDETVDAVIDAAYGLVVRDLIEPRRYDALTLPWRSVVGPLHPDDADVGGAPANTTKETP